MTDEQYIALWERRASQDKMLWETPMLAATALSFLLAAAFTVTDWVEQVGLFGLAALVDLAAIQLMMKHRYLERCDQQLLMTHEQNHPKLAVLHDPYLGTGHAPPKWYLRKSSYRLWVGVLAIMGVFTVVGALRSLQWI